MISTSINCSNNCTEADDDFNTALEEAKQAVE
jgi:hypothetical protein